MANSDSSRGILHDDAAPERFSLRRYPICPALQPFVEDVWITRWDLAAGCEYRQGVLGHPCVNAVVDQTGPSGIFGIYRGRFERLLVESGRAVGIKFWPGAFACFFGRPVTDLSNRHVPFADVFGAAGDRYEKAVSSATDDVAMVALVEGLLIPCRAHLDHAAVLAREIVDHIVGDRAITRVEDVARRHNLTIRKLQRLFRSYVGATPKWVIQRYRIHEAVESLEAAESIDLANLSVRLGYSDQAHFSRDFQRLVGKPPSAYARDATDHPPERV